MSIRLEQICKSYGDHRVLYNVSTVFPENAATAIFGPSGSGKTTLINLLLGLEKPDSGAISGLPERAAAVFQEDRLLEELTAAENVLAVLQKRKRSPAERAALKERLDAQLRAVGLDPANCQPVSAYSGGMKRRVALVRAVMAKEEAEQNGQTVFVTLDEPFKGLDTETKERVLDYLRLHLQGATVLLVTHDEKDAQALLCAQKITLSVPV